MLIVIFVQRGAQGVTISLSVRCVPEEAKRKRGQGKKGLDTTALGMYDLENKGLT
jgi:hypothetical protein